MSVVRPAKPGESGKPWKVVDEDTGRILAECNLEKNANLFRRIHDAREYHKLRRQARIKKT